MKKIDFCGSDLIDDRLIEKKSTTLVTSRKTAFPKDNKEENAENDQLEKLWLPNHVFINLLSSELFIIRELRKKLILKCRHL